MAWGRLLRRLGCGLAALGVLCAFERPFREFNGVEYHIGEIPLPPDYRESAEWAFARLMFPGGWNDGYRGRFDGDFRLGLSLWTQDFPRADRHFSRALRRLTRIQARSVEQCVNLDEGDGYDWPWLYAVQVGEWGLTDRQAAELREYLLRGGFFVADDFHGATEYQVFLERMARVFPDRRIVDIPDPDPIFHSVYDLDDRYQIPGQAHLRMGYKYADGKGAHWQAIYDDKGRVMVAISFNSDLGDAWEWADDPYYPERFSDLAIRLGVNDVVYAMTH
jgi:hypothetical protein